jgi:hypothetical protein
MGSITEVELFPKMSLSPWSFWKQPESQGATELGNSVKENAEPFEQDQN